jgi:hypothetical protein
MKKQLDGKVCKPSADLALDTTAELSGLVERLAALSSHRKIDWSDSWTDEDLQRFRDGSVMRLAIEESEEPG